MYGILLYVFLLNSRCVQFKSRHLAALLATYS